MNIGNRNHQLIIERATVTVVLGVPLETLTTVATIWASKKNLNERRALENGVMNLEGTAIFNILFYDYPAIDKSCFVVTDGKTYTIHSIVENEKVDIDLICKIKE